MSADKLLQYYTSDPRVENLSDLLDDDMINSIHAKGLAGSSTAFISSALYQKDVKVQLIIMNDREEAAYLYNDLESIFDEKEADYYKKKILFFPASFLRPYEIEKTDNNNVLARTEVLKRLGSQDRKSIIVTYAEALSEKVVSKKFIKQNTLRVKKGESVNLDFVADLLLEYQFERVDFVVEPGQFALRGGLIDVFSFSNDHPYRIEFFGDEVNSIRSFDPISQLSKDALSHITIIPNLQSKAIEEKRDSVLNFFPGHTVVWTNDLLFSTDTIEKLFKNANDIYDAIDTPVAHLKPEELYTEPKEFLKDISRFRKIEFGSKSHLDKAEPLSFNITPQPSFNKNFELLIGDLEDRASEGFSNYICSENPRQIERLYNIFEDILGSEDKVAVKTSLLAVHSGFIDYDLKLLCYTDHQIFERYHKFKLRDGFKRKESITLKEIYNLQKGDFVTHIDHGVGRFDGMESIENNGKKQEAVRLIYKNGDILYVSIHSLHRIARYVGKEGTMPSLDKLGSQSWKKVKEKTKRKLKDIARDLIKLYAKRMGSKGIAYAPDTYLQHELEASFIYEDTPDQVKSTADIKKDMEAEYPMDRLVCGDVGFGKTEVAMRAAFKAVADSKQVAVLVPTTVLALQHFHSFRERFKNLPCNVDYINRFKTAKQQKETLRKLESGEIDVIIGTHRIVGKDVKFKDLGLMIIDEEQKFGVSIKEKLKQKKVNIDTLTLTATPIPRTLQFSLMGARDLSIINTPPPNRYPVHTELRAFNEETIRDAIHYEVSRGGQVFFLHNRVQNIMDIAGLISRLLPDIRVAIGHGQMDGQKLEGIMIDFIEGRYDVLVATTIIESGLDIPNANTIIINEAHMYGLSDLHQLRGRVGRSNKKAFCYLLTPPLSVLTPEARKRLKAIEEFSELGSGFNIAMRDLDIRGAGNILGAEQSGFISEIGFEMYQKILREAMTELKNDEFKDMEIGGQQIELRRECLLETDLEISFPQEYIEAMPERLSLYRELDEISKEQDLLEFEQKLIDRFGPLPPQSMDLIQAIRLRWLAAEIGFEKLVIKNQKMIGYFPGDQDDPFYKGPSFMRVIEFVKKYPMESMLKEKNEKLNMIFVKIPTVSSAYSQLKRI